MYYNFQKLNLEIFPLLLSNTEKPLKGTLPLPVEESNNLLNSF